MTNERTRREAHEGSGVRHSTLRRAASILLILASPILLFGTWQLSGAIDRVSCEASASAACSPGSKPVVHHDRTRFVSTCSVICEPSPAPDSAAGSAAMPAEPTVPAR